MPVTSPSKSSSSQSDDPIELDDVVQVLKGSEWGVLGVVMKISGPEIEIWGRNPGYLGSAHYRTQVPMNSVVRIGRGKIRPLKPNEQQRKVPVAPAKPTPQPQPQPTQQEQPELPVKRGPGRPRKIEPEPAPKNPSSQLADQASAMMKPAFGAGEVDSESISRPTPPDQSDLDPDLLRPLSVKLPSANDIPRRTQNPNV